MRKGSRSKRFILNLVILAVIVGIFGTGIFFIWAATLKIPDFSAFGDRKVIESTKIYDRTGDVLLWDIHEKIKRTVVPFENISRHAKNAIVAIEDTNFYHHNGIDIKSTLQAFVENIKHGRKRGASTITQQLVKNAILTRKKTYTRKLKEMVLALKLEKNLTKEEILNLYLNEIPYGGNIYGIEAASQNFFGKTARDLTLPEAAYLAALPQAPTYYSPYGNNRDALEDRKNLVLKRMLQLGFITERERNDAKNAKVTFIPRGDQSIKAPHFTIMVRAYLEQKYGKDAVENDGMKVITTLDFKLQAKAEELLAKHVKNTTKKFNAKNAGLVAIDPKTGQILAMVGSRDFFDTEHDGNFNVTLAHRQPGSSIKPFIYATAFKRGYTDKTMIFDLKTEFSSECNPDGTPKRAVGEGACYSPNNYDNVFRGPVSFRNALAQSINVPAVKVLYLSGLNNSLKTIRDMGITSLNDPNRYGLTLVLGGGEVSLLELTGAYGVFANNGVRNPTVSILRVEDRSGNVLEEFKPKGQRVISENISNTISSILSDNDARTPAFGPRSYLYFGKEREVAVKTGTTNDYRDAWVLGYTPNISVGVWFGNNDNSPMEKKVAGFIAAPLWNEFMREVFKDLPNEKFIKPKSIDIKKTVLNGEWMGGETYTIDKISGKRATKYTPDELREEKPIINVHSILHWVDKKNPAGDIPKNPSKDPQYELWEWPVKKWADEKGIINQTMDDIPSQFDDIHMPEYSPSVVITSPIRGATYNPKSQLSIKTNTQSKFGVNQIDYFLNNTFVGSSTRSPFDFSFVPIMSGAIRDESTLKLIVYDSVRNKTEVTIPIMFSSQ